MKWVGHGTYTQNQDGDWIENGALVDDDFPEGEVSVERPETSSSVVVTHSFEVGEIVAVTHDAADRYSPGRGPVQDVIADATGMVLVQFHDVTHDWKLRTLPSFALERASADFAVDSSGVATKL